MFCVIYIHVSNDGKVWIVCSLPVDTTIVLTQTKYVDSAIVHLELGKSIPTCAAMQQGDHGRMTATSFFVNLCTRWYNSMLIRCT